MGDNKQQTRAKGTATRAFGSTDRVSHDSSRFYNSRMYQELTPEGHAPYVENSVPPDMLDCILAKSSESMSELPDNSVHLMVTSPPYNVGKDYDGDLTLGEYLEFLRAVWSEVYRVLVPGGRACVNIANLGRRPYLPLNAAIVNDMIALGFLMRGEIIWHKGASAGGSTAWGSWKSPSNPILRDTHEYIVIFSKQTFRLAGKEHRKATISRDEFLEFTKSVWAFPSESATKIGHPAPFPIELPYRLIQLYTYQDDLVLDPFMGSGQTAIAAVRSCRHFVGYDVDTSYVALAQRRITEFRARQLSLNLFQADSENGSP